MIRRLLSFFCLGATLLSFAPVAAGADWSSYKQGFVSGDGRVMDLYQDSISHSEGQGYGLLLSLMNGDRPSFDLIHKWTVDNLQVRRDALCVWSWGKRSNGVWSVIDYNNASDGDILIAFALLKAAQRWDHPPYREAAVRIIRDIRTLLAVTVNDRQLIAPAYFGFNGTSGHTFNSGYFILPAFAEFSRVDDSDFWQRVLRDSRRLLGESRFSSLKLPADWVSIENGQVAVDRSRSPFFGYEAIRVPLYAAWHNDRELLAFFSEYLAFTERSGYLPGRVNLVDGSATVEPAPAGFYAVMGLCAERLGRAALAQKLYGEAAARLSNEPRDYFSNTLYLLARGRME
jgi:endoglucanase